MKEHMKRRNEGLRRGKNYRPTMNREKGRKGERRWMMGQEEKRREGTGRDEEKRKKEG